MKCLAIPILLVAQPMAIIHTEYLPTTILIVQEMPTILVQIQRIDTYRHQTLAIIHITSELVQLVVMDIMKTGSHTQS